MKNGRRSNKPDPINIPVEKGPNTTQIETINHIWAEFVKIHDLEQHVTDITFRRTGHILDYVFTQKNTGILSLEVGAFDPTFDHYPVIFQIKSIYLTDETPKMRRKNSHETLRAFYEDLKNKLIKHMDD